MRSDPSLAPNDSLPAGRKPSARSRKFPSQDRVMSRNFPDRLEQLLEKRIFAKTNDSVFGSHHLQLKAKATAEVSDLRHEVRDSILRDRANLDPQGPSAGGDIEDAFLPDVNERKRT